MLLVYYVIEHLRLIRHFFDKVGHTQTTAHSPKMIKSLAIDQCPNTQTYIHTSNQLRFCSRHPNILEKNREKTHLRIIGRLVGSMKNLAELKSNFNKCDNMLIVFISLDMK